MPATRPPSVSEVYAAFDAAALGVYRAAMSRSRSGVVRLTDLLAAVAAAEPGPAREQLSEHGLRLSRQPPGPGPAPVPLSNEAAVRAVLFRAFERAAALDSACITSGVLLDALLDAHPHLARRSAREPPCPAVPPREPAVQQPPFGGEGDASALVVGCVLKEWLAYQTAPVGINRDRALMRLQEILQRI